MCESTESFSLRQYCVDLQRLAFIYIHTRARVRTKDQRHAKDYFTSRDRTQLSDFGEKSRPGTSVKISCSSPRRLESEWTGTMQTRHFSLVRGERRFLFLSRGENITLTYREKFLSAFDDIRRSLCQYLRARRRLEGCQNESCHTRIMANEAHSCLHRCSEREREKHASTSIV